MAQNKKTALITNRRSSFVSGQRWKKQKANGKSNHCQHVHVLLNSQEKKPLKKTNVGLWQDKKSLSCDTTDCYTNTQAAAQELCVNKNTKSKFTKYDLDLKLQPTPGLPRSSLPQ